MHIYLTPKQETLAHVGHPDHQAGSPFVGRHHSMLAKLHRLPSLLWPCNLSRDRSIGSGFSQIIFDKNLLRSFALNIGTDECLFKNWLQLCFKLGEDTSAFYWRKTNSLSLSAAIIKKTAKFYVNIQYLAVKYLRIGYLG